MKYFQVKHLLEILCILFFSPLIIPIIIITSLIIKISEPKAPIFYTQNRMGLNGCKFKIYKFRSMTYKPSKIDTNKFASEEQHRITKFGRIIRKYRIDEFPQFYNILKGDMSLICPRPEQYDIAKEYILKIDGYSRRHVVRPGITGLAQVINGYTDSEDKTRVKLKSDLEYIENMSFKNDLLIMLETIRIMATGFGAK
jgi:lipopolysaccharide/colanic/teichoic acid biosynthesis glycosyltransferase